MVLEAASDVTERYSRQDLAGMQGRLESHFGISHPNPGVSAGESIEVHAWLRAEWEGEMNALCKRRENWGGEVWSCLYTQMRLLETGWVEIGHDQFHHLDRGGAVCKTAPVNSLIKRIFRHLWSQQLQTCIQFIILSKKEKVVFNQLNDFMKDNGIFEDYQSGLRANHQYRDSTGQSCKRY